jgi:signal peptidase I
MENKFGEVSQEDIEIASEAAPEDLKEKKPVKLLDELLEWLESFVFALFVVILIFTFFFRIVLVDGRSMNNTLSDGDKMILSHLFYTPERGDIVVINSTFLNKTIIKRVIGIEGDHVVVDYNTNTVTVNGEAISNDCIKEAMYDTEVFDTSYETSEHVYEYDVPDDCVFVMGDNRNNSKDSRSIGFVENDTILGKAILRLYPLEMFGRVD